MMSTPAGAVTVAVFYCIIYCNMFLNPLIYMLQYDVVKSSLVNWMRGIAAKFNK